MEGPTAHTLKHQRLLAVRGWGWVGVTPVTHTKLLPELNSTPISPGQDHVRILCHQHPTPPHPSAKALLPPPLANHPFLPPG